MNRCAVAARALLTAVLASGCGSTPAARPANPAAQASYTEADCSPVLAALPQDPPATASVAVAEMNSLEGLAQRGTTLWALTNGVRADLLNISFDLNGLSGGISGDLSKYNLDVSQVRQYCKQ